MLRRSLAAGNRSEGSASPRRQERWPPGNAHSVRPRRSVSRSAVGPDPCDSAGRPPPAPRVPRRAPFVLGRPSRSKASQIAGPRLAGRPPPPQASQLAHRPRPPARSGLQLSVAPSGSRRRAGRARRHAEPALARPHQRARSAPTQPRSADPRRQGPPRPPAARRERRRPPCCPPPPASPPAPRPNHR